MDILTIIRNLSVALFIWCLIWFIYGLFKALWRDLNKPKERLVMSKHQALLNNCIDDDEAILHEREIEKGGTD